MSEATITSAPPPRTAGTAVRMTDGELAELRAAANRLGISQSDLLRLAHANWPPN